MTSTVPQADGPSGTESGSLDDLVADAAEVTRHLLEVPIPRRRVLLIPERARSVVAGLDSYGD
ncbi:MAG: hypothetical protein ABI807_07445 [Sporichthyaceae bacterium]